MASMIRLFEVEFMHDAMEFFNRIDAKAVRKIIYNVDKASYTQDSELFKKLSGEIWEFRTRFKNTNYRLLAFWDRTSVKQTLVICSHGFIKKSRKIPDRELAKAQKIRVEYFK